MPARQKNRSSPASRQRGVVLMLLLLLVSVGALAVFVSGLNRATVQLERDRITSEALAQAKEALIGRAVADDNRPGSLPCPDLITNIPGSNVPNDGIADLLVGNDCPSYIGRLPWRTLRLPDLRDGNGERLWYALSSDFRDDDSALINSDTPGTLTVTGSLSATQAIAILFAPGAALPGQARNIALQNAVANYLEGTNASSTTDFVAGNLTATFNDRLLVIGRDGFFERVERRVAGEVGLKLPHPYPNDLTAIVGWPTWFNDNNWLGSINYDRVSDDKATASFSGCLGLTFSMEWNVANSRTDTKWAGSC